MRVFGMPSPFQHGYGYFELDQRDEAERLAALIGATVQPYTTYGTAQQTLWKIEPYPPKYEWYALGREKLLTELNSFQIYQKVSHYPILETEVEALGEMRGQISSSTVILCVGKFPFRQGNYALVQRNLAYPHDGTHKQKEADDLVESYAITGRLREISKPAQNLIWSVWGADGGSLVGLTFKDLAQIESYTESSVLRNGRENKPYATDEVQRLTCKLLDGSLKTIYSYSVGYFEGYQFDLYSSEKEAKKALYSALKERAKSNWILTECLECGAVYDDAGHVEPGGMGCDRCNR